MEEKKQTVADIIGKSFDDNFLDFDFSEVQEISKALVNEGVVDNIAVAEKLQQKSLRCSDLLAEYLGKIVKIVSYLESKISVIKNKSALEYKSDSKITADLRKYAAEASPELENWNEKLAQAKGAKALIEKKFDIMIKNHHHYKEIAAGLRRGIVPLPITKSNSNGTRSDDWE